MTKKHTSLASKSAIEPMIADIVNVAFLRPVIQGAPDLSALRTRLLRMTTIEQISFVEQRVFYTLDLKYIGNLT